MILKKYRKQKTEAFFKKVKKSKQKPRKQN